MYWKYFLFIIFCGIGPKKTCAFFSCECPFNLRKVLKDLETRNHTGRERTHFYETESDAFTSNLLHTRSQDQMSLRLWRLRINNDIQQMTNCELKTKANQLWPTYNQCLVHLTKNNGDNWICAIWSQQQSYKNIRLTVYTIKLHYKISKYPIWILLCTNYRTGGLLVELMKIPLSDKKTIIFDR